MTTLDDYEMGACIGSGAFADVYRAVYLPAMRSVALKISRNDDESAARIRREIEVQRTLHHANVLPILDWDHEQYRWFATDVAEGNLGQIHEQKPLNHAAVVRLLEEVLAALGAAHRRHLVHRDLSPGNILRTRGQWVLADWGYVTNPDASNLGRLTRTGTAGGTFTWAAPEMLNDAHRVDARSDLCALGKIVTWLLTQRVPPIGAAPELPDAPTWKSYLSRLVADDPIERFVSAEDALAALTDVANDSQPSVSEIPLLSEPTAAAATSVAIGALKRYLVAPEQRIRLSEMVTQVTRQTIALVKDERFSPGLLAQGDELVARLRAYADCCRPIMHLLFNGCYWGDEIHENLWTECVQRLADTATESAGYTNLLELQRMPATLALCSGALGAISAKRYGNLAAVAVRTRYKPQEDNLPLVARANVSSIVDRDTLRATKAFERKKTPASELLFEFLRELPREVFVSDSEYESAFDRLEMLVALLAIDSGGWATGCFAWRGGSFGPNLQTGPIAQLRKEFEQQRDQWGPIKAGLFDGDPERVNNALAKLVDIAKAVGGF